MGQDFRTRFMLIFNIVILVYILVPRFKTEAGRWSWRESVGTIFAHWHSSHSWSFGDVFPSNELGSFFGTNYSWHKYLMAERLKGPGFSPFPLVGSITYQPHLTYFPLHEKTIYKAEETWKVCVPWQNLKCFLLKALIISCLQTSTAALIISALGRLEGKGKKIIALYLGFCDIIVWSARLGKRTPWKSQALGIFISVELGKVSPVRGLTSAGCVTLCLLGYSMRSRATWNHQCL